MSLRLECHINRCDIAASSAGAEAPIGGSLETRSAIDTKARGEAAQNCEYQYQNHCFLFLRTRG